MKLQKQNAQNQQVSRELRWRRGGVESGARGGTDEKGVSLSKTLKCIPTA